MKIVGQFLLISFFMLFFWLHKKKYKKAIKQKKWHFLTGEEAINAAESANKIANILSILLIIFWVLGWVVLF